jgi:hypothetical protein
MAGKKKHNSENQGAKLRDHTHTHRPFLRHAHRDWRVWTVVVLMLALMLVYVLTDDLSLRPAASHSAPRMPANVGP